MTGTGSARLGGGELGTSVAEWRDHFGAAAVAASAPSLRTHGAVVFRATGASVGEFEECTRILGNRFLNNGESSRQTVGEDGLTQTVNAGAQLIPFHAEMGYTPFAPDLVWLYCVRPAGRGGETILCDGVALWRALPPSLRSLFEGRRLLYTLTYRAVGQLHAPLGVSTDEDVLALLGSRSDVEVSYGADGSLVLHYRVDAVRPTRLSGEPAFCNSVIVEPNRGSFDDGSPISQEIRMQLLAHASDVGTTVRLRPTDVVMIDNTRVMHGRMPFLDNYRQVLVRMSYARDPVDDQVRRPNADG